MLRLVTSGTLEEKVYRTQVAKAALALGATSSGRSRADDDGSGSGGSSDVARYFCASDLRGLLEFDPLAARSSACATADALTARHGGFDGSRLGSGEHESILSHPSVVATTDHGALFSEPDDTPPGAGEDAPRIGRAVIVPHGRAQAVAAGDATPPPSATALAVPGVDTPAPPGSSWRGGGAGGGVLAGALRGVSLSQRPQQPPLEQPPSPRGPVAARRGELALSAERVRRLLAGEVGARLSDGGAKARSARPTATHAPLSHVAMWARPTAARQAGVHRAGDAAPERARRRGPFSRRHLRSSQPCKCGRGRAGQYAGANGAVAHGVDVTLFSPMRELTSHPVPNAIPLDASRFVAPRPHKPHHPCSLASSHTRHDAFQFADAGSAFLRCCIPVSPWLVQRTVSNRSWAAHACWLHLQFHRRRRGGAACAARENRRGAEIHTRRRISGLSDFGACGAQPATISHPRAEHHGGAVFSFDRSTLLELWTGAHRSVLEIERHIPGRTCGWKSAHIHCVRTTFSGFACFFSDVNTHHPQVCPHGAPHLVRRGPNLLSDRCQAVGGVTAACIAACIAIGRLHFRWASGNELAADGAAADCRSAGDGRAPAGGERATSRSGAEHSVARPFRRRKARGDCCVACRSRGGGDTRNLKRLDALTYLWLSL